MIRMAIVDDNLKDIEKLKHLIDGYCGKNNLGYSIVEFLETDFNLNNFNDIDILFLDIKINKNSGLEFGKKIRKLFPELVIIIESSYPQYLIDGYSIDAKRYFIKPIDKDIFEFEIEKVIESLKPKDTYFYEKTISPNRIPCKSILYIEFVDRTSIIHFVNGKNIKTNFTLKYWEDKLRIFDFAKPYRSFYVNLEHVKLFSNEKKDILMSNEEIIPISRLYKKQFKADYYDYIFKES